jgi:hypothetical protein
MKASAQTEVPATPHKKAFNPTSASEEHAIKSVAYNLASSNVLIVPHGPRVPRETAVGRVATTGALQKRVFLHKANV